MSKEYTCARECECDDWHRGKEVELPDTITLKRIYSTHCQVCGRPHWVLPISIVYFVPLDNNIVCHDCAIESGLEYEPRIYKEGE